MSASNESARAAAVKDIGAESPFCAKINGVAIAIYKTSAGFVATDNLCPHMGGPLCEGEVKNDEVTCPWHGSRFDLKTGQVVHGPAQVNVKTYKVEVRGDDIFVTLG